MLSSCLLDCLSSSSCLFTSADFHSVFNGILTYQINLSTDLHFYSSFSAFTFIYLPELNHDSPLLMMIGHSCRSDCLLGWLLYFTTIGLNPYYPSYLFSASFSSYLSLQVYFVLGYFRQCF
jgi:hypothetical protein